MYLKLKYSLSTMKIFTDFHVRQAEEQKKINKSSLQTLHLWSALDTY